VLALKHGAALGKLGKLGNWAMENSRIEWHRNCKREYKEDRDITSTVKLWTAFTITFDKNVYRQQ